MTGILIVLGAVSLLVAALTPAHRRATRPFRPGADLSNDRDHQRLTAELAAVDPAPLPTRRRVGRALAAAGGAVPFHRATPRFTH